MLEVPEKKKFRNLFLFYRVSLKGFCVRPGILLNGIHHWSGLMMVRFAASTERASVINSYAFIVLYPKEFWEINWLLSLIMNV